MGKDSRRKAERRAAVKSDPELRKNKEYNAALSRVRSRGASVEEFMHIASRGMPWFQALLDHRHEVRFESSERPPKKILMAAYLCLTDVPPLDAALLKLGYSTLGIAANSYGRNWPSHYAWGLNSIVSALRLTMVGQYAGAALIARNQLERWTQRMADVNGWTQTDDESFEKFMSRVWAKSGDYNSNVPPLPREIPNAYPTLQIAGGWTFPFPLTPSEATNASVGSAPMAGDVYADLSELIHGREHREAVAWESHDLLKTPSPDIARVVECAADLILSALRLSTICLRGLIDRLSIEKGKAKSGNIAPFDVGLMPPIPWNYTEPVVRGLAIRGRAEPSMEQAVRKYDHLLRLHTLSAAQPLGPSATELAFVTRRVRAIRTAGDVFAVEDGEPSGNPSALPFEDTSFGFNYNYIMVAESTGLLSGWLKKPEPAAAAALAASAVRTAYWLWLEDDDRSMAALRTVLEMAVQLRVWRRNPYQAAGILANPGSKFRDWLGKAGVEWKPLSPLNDALNKMSHAQGTPLWRDARHRLEVMNPDRPAIASGLFTGRGAALKWVHTLLAQEILESASDVDSQLGDLMKDRFADHDLWNVNKLNELNRWMNHLKTYAGQPVVETRPLLIEP
ncbi:hypothetical protein SAMN05661080_04130 [Modestobacter sp. DSM 44400]|uniref:hypothetical protein n=1 Tax=Modestobacter sp. DSM 44400 TaxID=1550230 RepID=UPI0008942260|nr:hypothetical protein [Modestobacter sp. DSM 44400]SDY63867.1 hypothetical protein SAMN05661080_04130 [Modestobacter sp. DSM 44400]